MALADALQDTERAAAPVDPLAALEKTTDAKNHVEKVQVPRIESLQHLSDHYNSDPYSVSTRIRKRFREEKKVEKAKQKADDELKDRYGLPETLGLIEDSAASRQEAKDEWEKGVLELERQNKRQKLAIKATSIPAASSVRSPSLKPPGSNTALTSLRARILENTARRSSMTTQKLGPTVRGKQIPQK